MYKLIANSTSITRLADTASIPADPANRDYADYLEWLAAGNTPAPADPVYNPRIAEIKARLAQIDIESIRALRTKSVDKGKAADDTKLSELDAEADNLRAELAITPEFA
jgi:hypothetical protein